MTRPARVVIDLDALRSNLAQVKQIAPVSRVLAVVKANGYGHGATRIARGLEAADAFGVASLEEGIALRDAGIQHPIVLLEGFFSIDELDLVVHHGFQVAVHQSDQLEILEKARLMPLVSVWVKIDTGMHRLGFAPEQVPSVVQRLEKATSVKKPLRYMSHLACADELENPATLMQQDVMVSTLAGLKGERSLANSAGIVYWPVTHMDWVRPGIMLYGVSPTPDKTREQFGLKPVMKLCTELIAVAMRKKGEAIGYGGDWVCPEDMPVGVAAIGYGDGYPRHAPPDTPVLVNGVQVPLIGRVSMDMVTLDLRPTSGARIGDAVELWGPGLPVETVAELSGTIAYELLCGVASRVTFEVTG